MEEFQTPFVVTEQYLRDLQANGPIRRLRRFLQSKISLLHRWRRNNHCLAYTIWQEIDSCLGRIRFLCTKEVHLRGLPEVLGNPQTSLFDDGDHACNAGRLEILAAFPKASVVDVYLFLLGWERALEWAAEARIRDSGIKHRAACASDPADGQLTLG